MPSEPYGRADPYPKTTETAMAHRGGYRQITIEVPDDHQPGVGNIAGQPALIQG